jgi:hypothetical protein
MTYGLADPWFSTGWSLVKYLSEHYPNTSSFGYLLLRNLLIGPVDGIGAVGFGVVHYGLTFLSIAITTLVLYCVWTCVEKLFSRMRSRRG